MTTKFTKKESERLADYQAELREKANEIEAEFEKLSEPIAAINSLIADYNEKLQEARGFVEDIANEVESYTDDKSDNWRDGERGSAIIDWLNELQSVSLEDVEEIEMPEAPTFDHDGTLENIPQEASL